MLKLLKRNLIMYHTFISYRSEDYEAAGNLTRLLQGLGLRVWWDRDSGERDQAPRFSFDTRGKPIPGNDSDVEAELRSAIYYSILVTVVTSAHTLKSVWVRKEISLARSMQKPLYFWHLTKPGEAEKVSMRCSGNPDPNSHLLERIETMAKNYERKLLSSSASIEFMKELSAQGELNTIGHEISPLSEVDSVYTELNEIIELGEFILHNGEAINADSIWQFYPKYEKLCEEAAELEQTIFKRFGRQVSASRKPYSHAFRLKRPWVLSRIKHLKRLLNDESFRAEEFRKLGG